MTSPFADANRVQKALRTFAASSTGAWFFSRTAHHLDRALARATKGRKTVAGVVFGVPTVLLTTTGAKTGQPRCVPVLGVPYGAFLGLIASNWGQAKHPAWYYNLKADPEAEISVDGDNHPVRARLATSAERDEIWTAGLAYYPGWRNYEVRAGTRYIEAFVLDRRVP
ncbi:nitroreductase family deazaflavin-dependent oxidoreductase [Kribbella sp. NPDC050241]|uniref:nitroreductase family deazaflavin-dependent oxidoreductase n=1 Tax=Kribbella sp. NPDC050241 TaxID=3364115 RepID=UPI003795FC12